MGRRMDEHEAIARLKRGDISGLELLVRRYQAEAIRAAYLITRGRSLAEDLDRVSGECVNSMEGRSVVDSIGHCVVLIRMV